MPQASVKSQPIAQRPAVRHREAWLALAVCGLLVAAVFAVFGQTLWFDFSSYDDSIFTYGEPNVTAGLTW